MSFPRNYPCTLCGEPEFHLNHMAFINNEINRLPFHAYEAAPSQPEGLAAMGIPSGVGEAPPTASAGTLQDGLPKCDPANLESVHAALGEMPWAKEFNRVTAKLSGEEMAFIAKCLWDTFYFGLDSASASQTAGPVCPNCGSTKIGILDQSPFGRVNVILCPDCMSQWACSGLFELGKFFLSRLPISEQTAGPSPGLSKILEGFIERSGGDYQTLMSLASEILRSVPSRTLPSAEELTYAILSVNEGNYAQPRNGKGVLNRMGPEDQEYWLACGKAALASISGEPGK